MKAYILSSALLLSVATAAQAEDLTAKLTTSLGVVEVKLYSELAPKTVANFATLAKAHFYDGLIFHRIMPGFAVQTGDPTGKGGGGPGYCFADEFGAGLSHARPGMLSMVNTAPGANGSQFLITLVAAPVLDGRNPLFGEVTSGIEVVQKIAAVKVEGTRPLEDVKLEKVEIVGDLTLPPPDKTPELTLEELRVETKASVEKLLGGLGAGMNLGALKDFRVEQARSRCAESQLAVTADFEKKAGAHLLLYGKSDGKTYEVQQLQWKR